MTTETDTFTAVTALQAIRDNAAMAGWVTIGDNHNQRLRIASRIYDLDAGWASGAVWVGISFRRAGKPNTTVLAKWTLADFTGAKVLELLQEVSRTIEQSERRILGADETEES